jgi:small ubiquitin-related modifier
MSTTPVKVRRGAAEVEERGTGMTPVRVRRGADEEEERGTGGTTPVKVASRVVEESGSKAGKTPVKVKPESPAVDSSLINIKVRSQTAADVYFRVKRDAKLRRLIDKYCREHSLDPKAVKFLGPDGSFLQAEQELDEAGLEDGDDISLVLDQVGGGGALPVHVSQFTA